MKSQTVFKIRNKKTGEWLQLNLDWSSTNGRIWTSKHQAERFAKLTENRVTATIPKHVEIVEFELLEKT
jgi:hypothetical protein